MILKFNGTQILNNFTNEVVFADRIISQTFNSNNTFEFVFASKAKITGTYQKVGDEYILNLTNGYTKDEIDAKISELPKQNLRIYNSIEERDADTTTTDGMICNICSDAEVFDLASNFPTGTKILDVKFNTNMIPPFVTPPAKNKSIWISEDGYFNYKYIIGGFTIGKNGNIGKGYDDNPTESDIPGTYFDGTNWNENATSEYRRFVQQLGTTSPDIKNNAEYLNWFQIKGVKHISTIYKKINGEWIEMPDFSEYYTKSEIDAQIGNINQILASI